MAKFIDRAGRRYRRLLVLGRFVKPGDDPRVVRWLCRCDCGRIKVVRKFREKIGPWSCGCLQPEVIGTQRRTHGMTSEPEYEVWCGMKARCNRPTNKEYKNYGARGIKVCPEWEHDFAAFFAHVGKRPSPSHSLDRIDNERGYEPGNVRWATPAQQLFNTRQNRRLTHDGHTHTLSEWETLTGVDHRLINQRLKQGWSIADALSPKKFHRFHSPLAMRD